MQIRFSAAHYVCTIIPLLSCLRSDTVIVVTYLLTYGTKHRSIFATLSGSIANFSPASNTPLQRHSGNKQNQQTDNFTYIGYNSISIQPSIFRIWFSFVPDTRRNIISDLLIPVANIPGRSTLRTSSCGNLVVPSTNWPQSLFCCCTASMEQTSDGAETV